VAVLGHDSAPFPLRNPGLVSIPLAFLAGMVMSVLSPEPEAAEAFPAMQHRLHLGPEEVMDADPSGSPAPR
jgi:cation/acetate symporter